MKMFNRRIVSVIIAVVTILTASAITSLPVGATSRSVSDALNWCESQVGKKLDYDGVAGYQCVDFIYYYYQYLGVSPVGGNAYEYQYNTLPSGWQRFKGGTPQPGDILVYSNHVGVYASPNLMYHQAPSMGGYVMHDAHNYNFYGNYWGCIRPNFSDGQKSVLTISGVKYPVKKASGGYFEIFGVITSPYILEGVGAAVYSNGKCFFEAAKWNKEIYSLDINNYVAYAPFSKLPDGEYTYIVFAQDERGYEARIEKKFTVGGSTTTFGNAPTVTGKHNCNLKPNSAYSWDSGSVLKTATCTESGLKVYTCRECNATKTETISAKGHQYGSWTTVKEATIAQDGESRTYCSNCDAYKTKRIPRLSENLSSDFDDVKSDSWYKPYIDYAYTYGLLKGTGVRQMQPERTVTRAEFVQILASLAGVNTSNKNVFSGFADVKPGQWYTPAVKWASENGIVSGISATKFAPNNKITREQMCTMLVKFIENYMHITIKNKNQKTTFTDDAFISSWAKYSVYKCQTGGLVSGVSASLFAPKNYATRASAAVIISQFHAEYAK